MTKQALMRLSVCAGVIWSPDQSKRIDDGSNRNYIAYRAVGGIRKADGQPVFFSAEYDIDFEVLEEELRENYTKKTEDPPDWLKWLKNKTPAEKAKWIDDCVHRDILQKRKFKLRLCEAGAMNRVLRMLLGIKQAYTTKNLEKPFVMARIVFRPDFSDASVKQQFIEASIKAMTGLYGPGSAVAASEKTEPINVTPLPEEEEEKETGNGGGDQTSQGPVLKDIAISDFKACNTDEQVRALQVLAKKKGATKELEDYVANKAKKPLGELKPETRLDIFAKFFDRPDDDVPF
jgi:hypothetical protein